MWKMQPTCEIQAKVMWQTHLLLMLHSTRLHLSIGEVIDRALLNVTAKTPGVAATFVCEQFAMATSEMSEEDMRTSLIMGIAMLVQPILKAGTTTDDLWDEILEMLENTPDEHSDPA